MRNRPKSHLGRTCTAQKHKKKNSIPFFLIWATAQTLFFKKKKKFRSDRFRPVRFSNASDTKTQRFIKTCGMTVLPPDPFFFLSSPPNFPATFPVAELRRARHFRRHPWNFREPYLSHPNSVWRDFCAVGIVSTRSTRLWLWVFVKIRKLRTQIREKTCTAGEEKSLPLTNSRMFWTLHISKFIIITQNKYKPRKKNS